jgi:hypothetical protein
MNTVAVKLFSANVQDARRLDGIETRDQSGLVLVASMISKPVV